MTDGSEIPFRRRPRIHDLDFFAGPRAATPPFTLAQPAYPDFVPGPPRVAHRLQFFASPIVAVAATAAAAASVHPHIVPGPSGIAHLVQFFSQPTFTLGNFPGYGVAGAATFVLSLEPGAKVTYSWGTDIFKSYSGREQRCNTTGPLPRQRFEGSAFLLDGADRDLRGVLQRAAAAGSTFLLALPYEELRLSADSVGAVLTVATTTRTDWAIVTQRVVVIGTDGSTTSAVIQAVTATTIAIDAVLGSSGRAGSRIQPLIQVLLDPQQGFSRYPASVDLWAVRALANTFGWVGADSMGRGAQIATYATSVPIDASTLTDTDLLIWDRPNLIADTAPESMLSLSEVVDLGALPFGIGGATVPDWARSIKYSSSSQTEWQWLKAFLRQVLGRQKAFLLSTNRADLSYISTLAGGQIKVSSGSVTGAGDYTSWWTSLAHRPLAITKSNGSVQYVSVISAPVDNGDGTLTLTLDGVATGTVARISMAEQVRIDNNDNDDIPVTWDGAVFSVDLLARTTEETITAHGKPTTAAQMATACRGGTWTAGWLCQDTATPLVAAFGGSNLNESAGGGSPVYQLPGPFGDKTVRVTVTNTGWSPASTSFLDVDNTKDLCGAVVMRTQLPLSVSTTILSKIDFAGGPGFVLSISSTAVSILADHSTPGNVIASATVPDGMLASNEWFVVMFAMDRGAGTMRIAIRSLISGASSVGASQSIAGVGSLTSTAPFRLASAGGLGNTLEIDALYMGVGVGAAAGLGAGLAIALSNFVTYLGA